MNIVIVPSHNQSKNIEKIVKGYEKQSLLPDLVLFVFDRCTDDSRIRFLKLNSKINVQCIIKTEGSNFSAGMTRDFGISYVLENYPNYKNIIFTDGDCVPSENLVNLHVECLKNSSKPALSCGRRIMIDKNNVATDDERILNKFIAEYSFTDKNSRLLISNSVTLDSILTYSCNLAFNKTAIDLCKRINNILSNSDRVFNPEFDGSWGGEDNFISDCLFRTGNNILLTSKDCYVEHIWHEYSEKNDIQTKIKIIKRLSNELKRNIIIGDLPGDYTVFEKNRNISLPQNFNNYVLNNIKCIQKEECGLDIINKLNFKSDDEYTKIVAKYVISRNRVIVNASKDNPKMSDNDDLIQSIFDYISFSKFYLINDEIVYDDDKYDWARNEQRNLLFINSLTRA